MHAAVRPLIDLCASQHHITLRHDLLHSTVVLDLGDIKLGNCLLEHRPFDCMARVVASVIRFVMFSLPHLLLLLLAALLLLHLVLHLLLPDRGHHREVNLHLVGSLLR